MGLRGSRIDRAARGPRGLLGRMFWLSVLLGLILGWMLSPLAVAARRIYTGGVSQTAVLTPPAPSRPELAPDALSGVVLEAATGQPLAGAVVQVPALGRWVQSGPDGRFALNGMPAGQRLIINIAKPGYRPQSLALEMPVLRGSVQQQAPLRARLQSAAGVLILDNTLRHLGDNQYSTRSAGAGQFQAEAGGTALRLNFSTQGLAVSRPPVVRIGAVLGLDTAAAQAVGQSRLPVVSSPARILLNGRLIGQLALNGSDQAFVAPLHALVPQGQNTLEIRTGVQLPASDPPDYDDMELMTITVSL